MVQTSSLPRMVDAGVQSDHALVVDALPLLIGGPERPRRARVEPLPRPVRSTKVDKATQATDSEWLLTAGLDFDAAEATVTEESTDEDELTTAEPDIARAPITE